MPNPSRRVALVCFRDSDLSEITFWRDRAEAQEASRRLLPCSSACTNSHATVFVDVGGRIRTELCPAHAVLLAPVIPGTSRALGTHRRLIECPFCGERHPVSQRHIGTVRAAACLQGFYRITNGDNENGQPEEEP
jgi:hypothetical protein